MPWLCRHRATRQILKSTAIYFNNHGIWFDETSSKQGEISVEHWVAKLFAKTAVGTFDVP